MSLRRRSSKGCKNCIGCGEDFSSNALCIRKNLAATPINENEDCRNAEKAIPDPFFEVIVTPEEEPDNSIHEEHDPLADICLLEGLQSESLRSTTGEKWRIEQNILKVEAKYNCQQKTGIKIPLQRPVRSKKNCKETTSNILRKHKGEKETYYSKDLISPSLSCNKCDMVLSSKHDLSIHQFHAHSTLRYGCDICGECFSNCKELFLHRSTHRKDISVKKNPPSVKKSEDKREIEKVVEIKELKNVKLYKVKKSINCQLEPLVGEQLKRSVEMQKSYEQAAEKILEKCDDKNIQFIDKSGARISVSCEKCSKVFSRKQDLHVHQFHAHTTHRFGCDMCEMRFSNCNALFLHRLTHKTVMPLTRQVSFHVRTFHDVKESAMPVLMHELQELKNVKVYNKEWLNIRRLKPTPRVYRNKNKSVVGE